MGRGTGTIAALLLLAMSGSLFWLAGRGLPTAAQADPSAAARPMAGSNRGTRESVPAARPGRFSRSSSEREPVQRLWERPLAAVRSLALAPDGSFLAALVVSRSLGDQQLRLYDRAGSLLWERWVPQCSRLIVGRAGRLVAAYEPRSALFRTLYLWEPGPTQSEWTFADPIQDVTVADSTRRVAVGTLSGEVILLQRDEAGWRRLSSWRTEPPVHQLAFGPQQGVWVAAGDPPAVACYGADGALTWRAALAEEETGRAHPGGRVALSASADGRLVLVSSELDRSTASELQLWSWRGRRLWRLALEGRALCSRLADSGDRLVVSYERVIARQPRLRFERVLACFDASGTEQWHQGGAFFSPLLVALEARGDWVLSLGRESRFRLLGRGGEPRWRWASPAPVQVAVGARDGGCAAVYHADGQLMFLGISSRGRTPG